MFQAYICIISAHIPLAKSSHVARPQVKGKGRTVLWGELQSFTVQGLDPGAGEELEQWFNPQQS